MLLIFLYASLYCQMLFIILIFLFHFAGDLSWKDWKRAFVFFFFYTLQHKNCFRYITVNLFYYFDVSEDCFGAFMQSIWLDFTIDDLEDCFGVLMQFIWSDFTNLMILRTALMYLCNQFGWILLYWWSWGLIWCINAVHLVGFY